jgi:lipopolysaccharide transport system ATP-binding protein
MGAAVVFDKVSKSYRKGTMRYRSLRDDLVTMVSPWSWLRQRETFWALRDISFEVPAGTALGIIGPNGSGKSTALKLMARITHPTRGTIRIRGQVGALIEVGAGIHPELTGRENIFLYGSIMGLRTQEIRAKFDRIVEFAEIGEFLDTPVKRYSSGMQVRLGFSVAAHISTDILLVDEVLAVGDAAFQTKCLRRIQEMRSQGVTILLVSHALSNVQRICSQTILLLNGQVAAHGPTPEIISTYYQVLDKMNSEDPEAAFYGRQGVSATRLEGASIMSVRLMDGAGRERPEFDLGEDLRVVVEYDAPGPIRQPNVSVSFNSSDWTVYTGADTKNDGFIIPQVEGRGTIELLVPKLGLGPGLYELNVGLWDEDMKFPYDWKWGARRFVVNSTRNLFAGRFMLPHLWNWRDGHARDERRP